MGYTVNTFEMHVSIGKRMIYKKMECETDRMQVLHRFIGSKWLKYVETSSLIQSLELLISQPCVSMGTFMSLAFHRNPCEPQERTSWSLVPVTVCWA